MAEPFDTLMQVQEHDTTLDQLRHRSDSLPERAELADVDRAPGRAGPAQWPRCRPRWTTWPAGSGASRSRSRPRPSAGTRSSSAWSPATVSASRDLQAMDHEVHQLAERQAHLEEEELALLEEQEPLDAVLAGTGPPLAALAAEAERLATAIAEAESAIARPSSPRRPRSATELAAALPADLAQRYEVLRSRLGGVGAARLVGDRCDGCHLTLPSVDVERIRHLPPEEFATCPQCDRILVH